MLCRLVSSIAAISLAAPLSAMAQTADSPYIAPRNEWGQPDLRGVWNFSSNTPLERPAQYADQEFLNNDDVARIRAEALEDIAQSDGNSSQGGVGGYNQFWIEGLPLEDNRRTSLIIDPPNGRMPARVAGAPVAFGGLGPDIKGERPVRFGDVFATLYQQLGLDPLNSSVSDLTGRPQYLVDPGCEVIRELV